MRVARDVVRLSIAALLVVAGTLHLLRPQIFLAQVPDFLPFRSAIVHVSGVIEILLGLGLLIPALRRRAAIATAVFLVAIFPGNVWQAVAQVDAFGLDTDSKRIIRLLFQPVLIAGALFGGNVRMRAENRRDDHNG